VLSNINGYEGANPANPFSDGPNRLNKGDIYESEELRILWEIHQDLNTRKKDEHEEINEATVMGLHDMVMEAVRNQSPPVKSVVPADWLSEDTKAKISDIRAIASDVDGTLLTSEQTVHPRTKKAIERAISMAFSPIDKLQVFFPATGKSRAGAMNSLGPQMAKLLSQTPGVFLQGLYCVDGQGEIVFQRKLNTLAVEAAEKLAEETEVGLIAYDADRLLTNNLTEAVIQLATKYGEPMPEVLETPISKYGPSVHKILFADLDSERLAKKVRPRLEALSEECDATVTQAMPIFLELLPSGCSKAVGVEKICKALNIDMSTQLLALGDAENDVEMLKKASIGIAMGNASPPAREAADFVLKETNNEGGAGVAMEIFGFGQY
jgi:Cof subfamily protein (haloacid dehalogenase superfamily)